MYLHLGDETIIPFDEIVGIFDLDGVTAYRSGRTFLQRAQRAGTLESVSGSLPKSFVVCVRDGRETVYTSPISAATLSLRMRRGIDPEIAHM